MIPNAIIQIAYSVLSWLIGILPTSTGFPQQAHDAMAGLGGYLTMWSPILPIATLLTCLGIVFGVEIGIFSFKGIKWIISHIPFIGGKGH